MQQSLIDTDILSMFLKGNKTVEYNFNKYILAYNSSFGGQTRSCEWSTIGE